MSGKNVLTRSKKQKALALLRGGQLEVARELYEEILRTDPRDAEAWCALGVVHGMQERFDEAVRCAERALALRPDYAEAYSNLSAAHEALGRYREAEAAARRALIILPDYADAHYNLGNALKGLKRFDEAIAHYEQALRVRSADAEAWLNLSRCHVARKSLPQAEACYREALKRRPDYVEAYNNLGVVLHAQGQFPEAGAMLQEALRLDPEHANAHINLALLLDEEGRLEEAARHFETGLRFKPDLASAWNDLGNVRLKQGRLEDALALYRRALSLKPESSSIHSNMLLALNYHPEFDAASLFAEHLAWGQTHGRTPLPADPPGPGGPAGGRLKVGYVSPDFRAHSVAYFLEPILAHHDPDAVEIFCYVNVARADDVTRRLQGLGHHWRDIRDIPDEQVAETIRADGIHILVDLAGHTADNRLPLFARLPAPVQVSYLGYPNTTGLPQMDYRLTDATADPPGQEAFHSERLLRLPRGFLCYRPPEYAPAVGPLPALEMRHITFGSFNAMAKINEQVVALWAQILAAVAHSRLLIKNHSLRDAATRERYVALFEKQGIAADRLEFVGWLDRPAEHLALYHRLDIALDTFPYHGTTTTCEALWMGVPVVTLAGNRHAGRVGVSLLTQLGLTELIAATPQEYVRLAVALAGDTERLARLRAGLRERMRHSPLLDAQSFTRDLEAAYREMWQRGREAEKP